MSSMNKEVRVRIAPSPTGDPHIGTAYIALFNYVFTKKHNGKFIIRIEDTDQKRYRSDSEAMILDALKWVGIQWDEGPDVGGPYAPYKQSERRDIYREYAESLIQKGHAYRCFCTTQRLDILRKTQQAQKLPPGYDRLCRDLPQADVEKKLAEGIPFVIRMKMPTTGKTAFKDTLRGMIEFENDGVDDQVLLKTDGFPTYHLAVVVDDHLMKITHVIRGEEWISSTPKHVMLYEMFGWDKPEFCHLPLLRNADKSKISKRKNPTSINYYRRKGILPETLRNFLALMGWNFGDNVEKFTTQEMIEGFTWDRMTLGGPVFDLKKLSWLNGQYLKQESNDKWLAHLKEIVFNEEYLLKIIPLIKERVEKFEDFIDHTSFFFQGDLNYTNAPLLPKGRTPTEVSTYLNDLVLKLDVCENWNHQEIHNIFNQYLTEKELKPKDVFMPVRVAVTGSKETPPLFECIEVLGKDIVQRRIRLAIEFLKTMKES
ncbi:glutamate--tRNA ligase [Pigmentibacter ruber]|uniref:glutamate--tRNA ligase n=1 Tax=Pigmentibacter ruber TaxID=2683196 RepID=UPI00192E3120|nr:glutamate--tRNA ligase [Pigmentibacter ruber]